MDSRHIPVRGAIAVVLKGYPRLSETFIAQELRGLELAGFTLRLVSMRRPTDAKTHPIHGEIEAPVAYLPEYLHQEPLRVLRGIAVAVRRAGFRTALHCFLVDVRRDPTRNRVRRFGQACVLVAELPADVARLYAHFIHTPAAVTRYAALITGLPWSCSAHAKDIWTSPDWDLAESIGAADWVATCTAVGHARLARLAPRPDSVHLVYHGLDLARFPQRGDGVDSDTLRDGADPAAAVRILCVGRAVPKKGIDTVLEALAQLPASFAWHFTHIGGGSERAHLVALAERLGIANRVTWRGSEDQSAVLAAYRSSDLFVLACRIADDGDRDGLPNVLVEAQSQRLACISTPVSAVPELIDDGVSGRLVPPNEPSVLADAILALGRDPTLRLRLARAGEDRVRTAFDYAVGIERLARLFPVALRRGSDRRLADASAAEYTACSCAVGDAP